MPKISIRLDDLEAKRIDRVCRAIAKQTDQRPSKAAIMKRWLFLQVAVAETAYDIPAPAVIRKIYGAGKKIDLAALPVTHQRVLLAVKELVDETNGQISPTFEEIGKRIGVTQSWAQRVCADLKKRGLLRWDTQQHRDVKIVGEFE